MSSILNLKTKTFHFTRPNLHILRIQLCTKYLGFGDGETYPFESGHGTQLNGTIVEGNTYLEKPLID